MRIACVHVPQFALQCLGRLDPSLRGAPVAVVGAGYDPGAGVRPSLALHSPIVLACSRAAWTLGVRLGMTANAARFVSPELRIVACDTQLERETVRAIADALLGVSAVVDTGGRVGAGGAHLAMYCEVPSKLRGTTFGDRLLDMLDTLGLAVRIGIADDRFTAWVAAAHGVAEAVPRDHGDVPRDGASAAGASHVVIVPSAPAGRSAPGPRSAPSAGSGGGASASAGPASAASRPSAPRRSPAAPRSEGGVVVVPRGGSAAFLAPQPLSLLAITPEVQHMLEALGVRTLGQFAALPAPSVSRPLEADYQALARGDSGYSLRPYAPEAPIREEIVVASAGRLFGGADAVTTLAERLASRLRGRERGASRFEVTVGTRAGDERVTAVTVDDSARPASTPDEIIALIAPVIGEPVGAGTRLRILVVGEAVLQADASAPASTSSGERAEPADSAESLDSGDSPDAPDSIDLGQLVTVGPGGDGPWKPAASTSLRGREPHRRTRRARRRRVVTVGQSQLFGNDRSGSGSG